jgi:hypothetical protein
MKKCDMERSASAKASGDKSYQSKLMKNAAKVKPAKVVIKGKSPRA